MQDANMAKRKQKSKTHSIAGICSYLGISRWIWDARMLADQNPLSAAVTQNEMNGRWWAFNADLDAWKRREIARKARERKARAKKRRRGAA